MNLFFVSLFLTIALESVIYILMIKKNPLMLIAYAALINFFTWPLANIFLSFVNAFFLAEFFVFLIELILIKALLNIKLNKAIIISLIANILTMFLGLAIGII